MLHFRCRSQLIFMAFYVMPPSGQMTLKEMVEIGEKRLDFLKRLMTCETRDMRLRLIEELSVVKGSECLIEGTPKDKLSHFILRMCASQDHQMSTLLVKSEIILFRLRWEFQSVKEKKRTFQSLKRQCRKVLQQYVHPHLRDVLSALESVSEQLMRPSCLYLEVPFQHVLDMVRRRTVVLKHGLALIPMEKQDDLLCSLFEGTLTAGTSQMLKSRLLEDFQSDPRLRKLFRHLQSKFGGAAVNAHVGPCKTITHEDLDRLSQFFPPCMRHMHSTLRKFHRLRHSARLRYTLFLKEAGLPLDEAVHFWKEEYSKPSLVTCCSHSWGAEDHRYQYSLRHMYGLEGCRKNYRSHTCQSMQSWLSSVDVGCPFMNVTSVGMWLQDVEDIVDLPDDQRAKVACKKYFGAQIQQLHSIAEPVGVKPVCSPVDFYRNFTAFLDGLHNSGKIDKNL